MVAKSATVGSLLVCADCGHPADSQAYLAAARRSWRAALALAGFALISGMVLVGAVMLDLHHGTMSPEPEGKERSE